MSYSRKQAGFTLIELITTLVIGSILISLVTPSLVSMVQNNRMASLHNDLLSDLSVTRSTAVTRGNSATLCASNLAGDQCLNNPTLWPNGWLVFDDIDNDGVLDTNETLLVVKNNLPSLLKMIGANSRVSFNKEGSAFGFSSEFAFCDSRGETAKRGLIVSNSGRSRVAKANEISVACL